MLIYSILNLPHPIERSNIFHFPVLKEGENEAKIV